MDSAWGSGTSQASKTRYRDSHKKAHDFGRVDDPLLASVGARTGRRQLLTPAVTNFLTATLHRLVSTQHAPPPRRSLSRLEIESCASHACVTWGTEVGVDGEVFSACAADPGRA
jgi:hypothetical protein